MEQFQEILTVSDDLRNSGNYKASLHSLNEWLNLYPAMKQIDRSAFDYSDTILGLTTKLPQELFISDSKVHWKKDSALFNGYVLNCQHFYKVYKATLYQKGALIETNEFNISWMDSTQLVQPIKFPFPQFVLESKIPCHWGHVIKSSRQLLWLAPNGDTASVIRYFDDRNFEKIDFSAEKDTLNYSIQLDFGETQINRSYQVEEQKGIEYSEYTSRPNFYMKLSLNETGDTLNFDQYSNGQKNGLQVFGGYDYLNEKISFRLSWENDTVVDILNTNILYLKMNMRRVSKEKYMKKNPINSYGFNPIGIYSDDLILLDKQGKPWVVIPYNSKNMKRFSRKWKRKKRKFDDLS